MYYEEFKRFSEALRNSLAPLTAIQLESIKTSSNALTEITESLYHIFPLLCYSEQLKDISEQLTILCKSAISSIQIPSVQSGDFDFLTDIDFQNEYVELSENDCESINTFLESSNFPENTAAKISKGRISLVDFVKTVLIPIFAILFPMLQNSYYHRMDAIESQKSYIEERQLKEDEIQLLKKQIQLQEEELQTITKYAESLESTINELIDYAKSQENHQEILESDSGCPELPKLSDEVQNFPDGVSEPLDDIQENGSSNPDVSNNSGTGMHKEQ